MRTYLIAIVAAAALAPGCGKGSKRSRCEKGFAQIKEVTTELAKGFGADVKEATEELEKGKAEFLSTCEGLPDDAIACIEDFKSKMTDPKCGEIMEKVKKEMNQKKAAEAAAKLKFEPKQIDHKRVTAMAPAGWTHDDKFGDRFEPPKDADLGFFTKLEYGDGCGGACEAKPAAEWEKVANEEQFKGLKDVTKDEKLGAGGRLVIGRKEYLKNAVVIVTAFWTEGGERYVYCRATLDEELAGAADAFEKACRETKVASFQASYSD